MRFNMEAVIFDLDGLVLDTEVSYFRAWQQAAETMGYPLSESFCRSLSGLHYCAVEQKITELCGANFSMTDFNQLSGEYWRNEVDNHGIAIKSGFHELLETIRCWAVPYCLATNSHLINALECLDLARLNKCFPVIVARDHVAQGKPAPDIFERAAECLSVNVSRCLVLEDSLAGVMAATAAGAYTVLVPSVLPVDERAAALCDRQYPDLHEVARWLRANFAKQQSVRV